MGNFSRSHALRHTLITKEFKHMGRNRYKIYETHSPHFLTCTIVNWAPIFTRPDTVQIVLDSWHFLQQEHQVKIYAYVILENHLHWIVQADNLSIQVSRLNLLLLDVS